MGETKTGSVRIVIPTTLGPVTVLEVAPQKEGASLSVACANRTPTQVGMSRGYNEFVTRETGLLSRLFSHAEQPHFRIDVDGPVDAGPSWQLAVLIAHAFQHAGWPEDRPLLVWATATVSIDLKVGRVAEVTNKLLLSEGLFLDAREEGREVVVLLASEDEPEVEPDAAAMLEGLGIKPLYVRSADEALSRLGLPLLEARAASGGHSRREVWGNPYVGLRPFEAGDRALFFGRGRAREDAYNRLRGAAGRKLPFLLIHGASGAGKSSFVRAGLAGDVEESRPGGRDFVREAFIPSSAATPTLALATVARKIAGADAESMPDGASEMAAATVRWLGRLADAMPRRTALIVIDQFEEVFDPALPEGAAADFARALDAVVRAGSAWVIATIRSDALPFVGQLPELARLTANGREMRLDAPSPTELLEIIEAPAALAGRRIEDRKVVDRVAAIAAANPEALPLIQTVMTNLFDEVDPGERPSSAVLDRLGGVEEIVDRWADGEMAAIVASGMAPQDLDRVLASLIRLDPAGRFVSRTVEEKSDRAVLSRLVDRRLATSVPGPERRVRLAHDILIAHWGHLRDLAERVRSLLKDREWLERGASLWADAGRSSSRLLRGEDVAKARAFLDQRLVHVEPDIAAFATASVDADRRHAATRKGIRWAAAAAAATVIATVSYLWIAADASRKVAERNLATATETMDAIVTNVAQGLTYTTGIPDSTVVRIVEAVGRSTEALRRDAPAATPGLELIPLRVLSVLASRQLDGEDAAAARASASQGVDIARNILAQTPGDPARTQMLAQMLTLRGRALELLGDEAAAKSDLTEAIELLRPQPRKAESGEPEAPTLVLAQTAFVSAAGAMPEVSALPTLMFAEAALGSIAGTEGDLDAAVERYDSSISISAEIERIAAEDPDAFPPGELTSNRVATAGQWSSLAGLNLRMGDTAAAGRAIGTALKMLEGIPADPSNVAIALQLSSAYAMQSEVLYGQSDTEGAEEARRRAIQTAEAIVEIDPGHFLGRMNLADALVRASPLNPNVLDPASVDAAYRAIEVTKSLLSERPSLAVKTLHARALLGAAKGEMLRLDPVAAAPLFAAAADALAGEPDAAGHRAFLLSEAVGPAMVTGDWAEVLRLSNRALAEAKAGNPAPEGVLAVRTATVSKAWTLARLERWEEGAHAIDDGLAWAAELREGALPPTMAKEALAHLAALRCRYDAEFATTESARQTCARDFDILLGRFLTSRPSIMELESFAEVALTTAGVAGSREDSEAPLTALDALLGETMSRSDLSPSDEKSVVAIRASLATKRMALLFQAASPSARP